MMKNPRILRIVDGTTVDGPGFRTSIYFAGCKHQCPGCHNPQSWDMNGGFEMSVEEIVAQVEENEMNVTYSGGDPLYQVSSLIPLSAKLKQNGRNIWCYTGFLFEEILNMPDVRPLLDYLDVVVDGPFIEKQRDTDLLFRGSSNQRIIDVAESLKQGVTVLWTPEF